MATARSVARHHAAYRALLRLYPPAFRTGYGDPMAQLFADRLRERGGRAWLETAPDLVRTVPSQRMEAVMARLGPGTRVITLVALVIAAVAASVGLGGGAVPVLLVAALALLVSRRPAGIASAVFGARAPFWRAVVQEWWAPVAALLGVAMLVFGAGTIFEAHNLGGRIFGSGLLLVLGATMLLGLMRRPFDRARGNSMILLATVPAFPFFWLVVPTVAAVVVWAGVLGCGFAGTAAAPAGS